MSGTRKDLCDACTTATLMAAYNNGTLGVGATLTDASGTFAPFVVDGRDGTVTTPGVNRILVAFQSSPLQNGIYTLTTNGDGISIPWQLTRASDYNIDGDIFSGDYVYVAVGDTYGGSTFEQVTPSVTVGTTAIVFNVIQYPFIPSGAISGNLAAFSDTQLLIDTTFPSSKLVYSVSEVATHTTLATAGKVNIQVANSGTAQYAISEIFLNVTGTNFSGGGGDRLLAITDGTTVYTVIPAASLQTLVNSRWGTTPVPYPAAASISKLTQAGANLYAQYSGGTTDYTSGSLTITLNLNYAVP